MLLKEKEGYVIPTFQDLLSEEDCREKAYYLFSIGERGYYLVDDLKVPEFGSYRLEGMQIFRELEPGYQAFAGITGSQIYRWRESRRFCGCCGAKMRAGTTERSMVCTDCGHTEYPGERLPASAPHDQSSNQTGYDEGNSKQCRPS